MLNSVLQKMVIWLVIKLQKKTQKPPERHQKIIQKQSQMKKKMLDLVQRYSEKEKYISQEKRKKIVDDI